MSGAENARSDYHKLMQRNRACRQEMPPDHRLFNKRYPEAPIIVTGCYAQLKSDEVAALPGVAIVAGADRKMDIDSFVERAFNDRRKRCGSVSD